MKIGLDTFACDGGKTGVGMYVNQFLRNISPSQEALFELYGWEYDRFAYSSVAPNFEFIPQCSIQGRTASSLWHIYRYPKFASTRQYDACFFPAAHRCLPYKSPCPTIGVVHDMAAYWGNRKTRVHLGAVLRMVLPNLLRHMDIIIAVSDWVKQELIDRAHVKENRIVVIPNGIDHSSFYPRQRNEESVLLIQPFSFKRPYVLCVSRIDHPIKNHIRLIEAFGIFKERTKFPHKLVLAGGDHNNANLVKEAADTSAWRNDIFFTGHFPPKSLPELYAGADFVVFPSMYEGFGMGVLEAMACGVPVVCARAASLPETAEHAALYFDPLNAEDMADRMVTVSTDRNIYNECKQLGLERVKLFSWEKCVERTLQIIYETAGK